MFEASVYSARRAALKAATGSGLILLPGNTEVPFNYPANAYHFRQDSDFLYFFGHDIPGLAGVIDVDQDQEVLFGDDLEIDDIIWMGPQEEMASKAARVGVKHAQPFAKLAEVLAEAKKKGRTIHFLPPYRAENKLLLFRLLGIHPDEQKGSASVALIRAVVNLRSVKDELEILELEKAAAIGYEMHTTAMKLAVPGALEMEIAGIMEGIALKHGGAVSFPIILSQNGETLHNHDHSQVLQEGRLLLVDAGAEAPSHYASDYTRTIPVGGKFTTRQREIYEIVLKANNSAFKRIKPGIPYKEIHLHACTKIAAGLTELGLMKGEPEAAVAAGAHALFLPHGLGHMMGLDVHDMEGLGENYVGYNEKMERSKQFGTAYLRMARELEPGFVITNEPGIYFIPALIDLWKKEKKFPQFINYDLVETYKGFGGIRLEDDILVTPDGCTFIGKRVPVTPEQIEEVVGR
ncbi:MAG: aminopeptidase P family protein [Bacteroidales bacterium]